MLSRAAYGNGCVRSSSFESWETGPIERPALARCDLRSTFQLIEQLDVIGPDNFQAATQDRFSGFEFEHFARQRFAHRHR